ncbi:MAG: carbon-nitrogen hydrolase family protein [Acidimicrobiales bacterium]
MTVNVLLGQVRVGWNISENIDTIKTVLSETSNQELVVLPEGMISGYDDGLSGLGDLDPDEIRRAVDAVATLARQWGVHLFCGTLLFDQGGWSNTAVYFSPKGAPQLYRKVNLATHERGRLVPGSELPLFSVQLEDSTVVVSPQLCRELRFPEQWHRPAREGAQVFVYLTHAANPKEIPGVWRSHLVSRAAETQRFVLAVNVAHPHQHCPTMVVSPSGEVLAEADSPEPARVRAPIDLDSISDWFLDQQRADVVTISYPGPRS